MKECLNCGYERQPKDEGIIPPTEQCHIIYDKIKDGAAGLKDAAGRKQQEMKRSKNMPVLVYLGLLGFKTREGAKGALWLNLILGICCFFVGSAAWGIVFLLGAALYSYAIKWADNNSAWNKQIDSHSEPKKRMGALGCLISIVLVFGIGFLFIAAPFIGEENTADSAIESMTPRLRAGMSRNDVTGILETNGFKINTTSPPEKNPENRQIYLKAAKTTIFSWIRYDVFIEYNENGMMKFARFLKSRHSDGRDSSCYIIFEIPVEKGTEYPVTCPANVQDF